MSGTALVTINDNQWTVLVANTATELTTGLSGVASLAAGTGMLFVLPLQQVVAVNTNQMLFPIDIIFIKDGAVFSIARNIEPGYLVDEATPIDMFLEVNAGEAELVEVGHAVDVTITTIQEPGFDINQIISFAIPLAILAFVFGMSGLLGSGSLSKEVRRLGKPRTEEERARVHEEFYGTKELPVRGKGLKEREESLKGRGLGEPKTEEERRETHLGKYGVEELPERGKGMEHPSSEEEATFPVEARKDLTFCKHMWDLEKTIGRPFTKEEIAKRWEDWKGLRYRSKTEEERGLVHELKYGTKELPERGKGLGEISPGERTYTWQIINHAVGEKHESMVSYKDRTYTLSSAYNFIEEELKVGHPLPTERGYEIKIIDSKGEVVYTEWYIPTFGVEHYSSGIITIPKLPEEAKGDFLFYEYIRDLSKLRKESLTEEEAKQLWEGWEEQRAGSSIHGEPRQRLVDKYGSWAVGRAEAICPENDIICVEREAKRLIETIRTRYGEEAINYITIKDPGKTVFHVGDVISIVAVERENRRVRELGEREATYQ